VRGASSKSWSQRLLWPIWPLDELARGEIDGDRIEGVKIRTVHGGVADLQCLAGDRYQQIAVALVILFEAMIIDGGAGFSLDGGDAAAAAASDNEGNAAIFAGEIELTCESLVV